MYSGKFWDWFTDRCGHIIRNYEDSETINNLDMKVSSEFPGLAWEIGPDPSGGWYFALSPNLSKEKFSIAIEAIAHAPKIEGWSFYATRQRKLWDRVFNFSTLNGAVKIDSSLWRYVLLRYPDGECEIFLIDKISNLLNEDDRFQVAAIAVEGWLGEKCIIDHNISFSLNAYPEPQFAGKEKPIRDLPRAFGFT